MKSNRSIYGLCLHVVVAISLLVNVCLFIELARRKAYEQGMIEIVKPEIQAICEELELDAELNDLEDLLEAFKEISTNM